MPGTLTGAGLRGAVEAARGALLAAHAASGLAAGRSPSGTRLLRAAEGLLRAAIADLVGDSAKQAALVEAQLSWAALRRARRRLDVSRSCLFCLRITLRPGLAPSPGGRGAERGLAAPQRSRRAGAAASGAGEHGAAAAASDAAPPMAVGAGSEATERADLMRRLTMKLGPVDETAPFARNATIEQLRVFASFSEAAG
ncbi:unnamed protein product [Prorocentrum cordatum]|uniref:Uncharacterized protein n=1 Tax=Prorocentrum cordatum TaxID=2364126 RepID=A0ABN9QTY3_9DINO|nr:unnamed protein product [Polarella glacialis]